MRHLKFVWKCSQKYWRRLGHTWLERLASIQYMIEFGIPLYGRIQRRRNCPGFHSWMVQRSQEIWQHGKSEGFE